MIKVDLKGLVDHLNMACRLALEEAAGVCVSAGHAEVAIEHFLVALCEQPGNDLRMILKQNNIDPDDFVGTVRCSLARFRVSEGNSPVFATLLVELLKDAWMIASIELKQNTVRSGAILLAMLYDAGRYCRFEYTDVLDRISVEFLKKNFADVTAGSIEEPQITSKGGNDRELINAGGQSALVRFAQNFTQAAREGRIDPVFCRDDEIHQIIDILARRRKNNPICVGEAGVGKTAVVEGLALKIVNNDVPDSLLGTEVYGLDMGALQAGASVKGEFEKRLKGVLDEIKGAGRRMILFIDEAHMLIGAGGQQGGNDAANLLKPVLARGEIKTIAATTWPEYKKYFEKDPALTRRFQLVRLDEPTVEQACIIIRGLVPAYEQAHSGVYISDAGVEAAARLASRYITGRQLPDKAIDVLDTACARVRAAATGVPLVIEKLNQRAKSLEHEKSTLERDVKAGHDDKALVERIATIAQKLVHIADEKESLIHQHEEQKVLVEELKALRAESDESKNPAKIRSRIVATRKKFEIARKDQTFVSLEVGEAEIASVISDWTGIPVSSMAQDEISSLLHLKENIAKAIKGQDYPLQVIQQQLQASRLDLHKTGRPLGVFLLIGPSGVGKTETAIEIARKLFGGEQFMTTINMTEFQEKHTVSRLIGSPPGYVGYGEGGILTEAIRKKPYSVVLLDEVEKADADVLNLFYQAFDKGMLNDGEGRDIDCKNVVFFLTSNLATDEITDLAMHDPPIPPEEILDRVKPVLIRHFKPALLTRMQPVVYLPLNKDVLREIIVTRLGELKTIFMERQGIDFEITDQAVSYLEALCDEAASGARLIDQLIQKRIFPEVSRKILETRLQERALLYVRVDAAENSEFTFTFTTDDEVVREAAE